MCWVSGQGNGSSDARNREQQRQNAISAGMESINNTFAKFDDPYYADFERKNLALATPDIALQKKEANNQTLYGLARSGNLDASTAAKQYGDVEHRNTQAIQQATDTAHTAAESLRGDVENQRSNLVSQLNATADASAAANAATSQAAILTRTPTYSPVTNIFSDLTGAIATNEQIRRTGQQGWGFGVTPVQSPVRGPAVVQQG